MAQEQADEFDRKYLPEFVQTAFCISLGACSESVEMMKTPQKSATAMFDEMKKLLIESRDAVVNPPKDKDSGDGLKQRFDEFLGVWAAKGMDLMDTWTRVGKTFTEKQPEAK